MGLPGGLKTEFLRQEAVGVPSGSGGMTDGGWQLQVAGALQTLRLCGSTELAAPAHMA